MTPPPPMPASACVIVDPWCAKPSHGRTACSKLSDPNLTPFPTHTSRDHILLNLRSLCCHIYIHIIREPQGPCNQGPCRSHGPGAKEQEPSIYHVSRAMLGPRATEQLMQKRIIYIGTTIFHGGNEKFIAKSPFITEQTRKQSLLQSSLKTIHSNTVWKGLKRSSSWPSCLPKPEKGGHGGPDMITSVSGNCSNLKLQMSPSILPRWSFPVRSAPPP